MRAHPLAEVRAYADLMLVELRKVIPAFLTRVDQPDRGGVERVPGGDPRATAEASSSGCSAASSPSPRAARCTLAGFDPDGETKVVAAAMYAATPTCPTTGCSSRPRDVGARSGAAVLRAYVGERRTGGTGPAGRSSGPRTGSTCCATTAPSATSSGTGCSRSSGSGSRPSTASTTPAGDRGAGRSGRLGARRWTPRAACRTTLRRAAGRTSRSTRSRWRTASASSMEMNAREALHLIELRISPQGHPAYRRVAWQMHDLIRDRRATGPSRPPWRSSIAADVDLERLEAERRSEARRTANRSAERPASDAARM